LRKFLGKRRRKVRKKSYRDKEVRRGKENMEVKGIHHTRNTET